MTKEVLLSGGKNNRKVFRLWPFHHSELTCLQNILDLSPGKLNFRRSNDIITAYREKWNSLISEILQMTDFFPCYNSFPPHYGYMVDGFVKDIIPLLDFLAIIDTRETLSLVTEIIVSGDCKGYNCPHSERGVQFKIGIARRCLSLSFKQAFSFCPSS